MFSRFTITPLRHAQLWPVPLQMCCNNRLRRYRHFSSQVSTSNAVWSSAYEPIHVLNLSQLQFDVPSMLYVEEILMRASKHNWLVFNRLPSDYRAVVMGIGGDATTLVHMDECISDKIDVYKRFTGGGTVFVDTNTRFVSLIVNESALPQMKLWPRQIMQYTQQLYNNVFNNSNADSGRPEFVLRDNDYCFGNLKFGGNAQSITSRRWLHHTSFLYDFDMNNIERYLQLPTKQPEYRQQRKHSDFICTMKEYVDGSLHDLNTFQSSIVDSSAKWFRPQYTMPSDEQAVINGEVRVQHLDKLNITDEMIKTLPLLKEVKRLHQYGKYTIGTKWVDLVDLQR